MKKSNKSLSMASAKFILKSALIGVASLLMSSCSTESIDEDSSLKNSESAEAMYNADPGEGSFYIQNKHNWRYLNFASDANGGNVYGGTSKQSWKFKKAMKAPNGHQLYYIEANSSGSDRVLDVAERSTKTRANVTIFDLQSSNNKNQMWYFKRDSEYTFDSTYMIFCYNSGMCLDQSLDANGADNIYMYPQVSGSNYNQRWAIVAK